MKSLLGVGAFVVVAAIASAQTAPAPLKAGDKAPDFALPNGDGKLVTLSEHTQNSPVLLVFYRGYW
jgi:hypothetical protein